MSDANDPGDVGTSYSARTTTVSNPADAGQTWWLGMCLLALALLTFYLLVASWPVAGNVASELREYWVPGKPVPEVQGYLAFRVFGASANYWAPDLRMFLVVILAGALGSLMHALTSFAEYVGNQRLSANWIWWFALRIPVGIALALMFYLVLRGGLVIPSLPSNTPGASAFQGNTTLLLNPYGTAAISALAGMFSRQATEKLKEVFESLFTLKNPPPRPDSLPGAPTLKFEPAELTKGKSGELAIVGKGFLSGCTVTVGTRTAVPKVTDTKVTIDIVEADVAKAGSLKIVITNPAPDGKKFEGSIPVVEAAATPAKPEITTPSPIKAKKDDVTPLTINGRGFEQGCKAIVDKVERDADWIDASRVTVKLSAAEVATVGKQLPLAIKNPGPNGQTSAPVTVEIIA